MEAPAAAPSGRSVAALVAFTVAVLAGLREIIRRRSKKQR
jgi:MYXO-CTERM domain-containing protein